jgi:hypothetical protein
MLATCLTCCVLSVCVQSCPHDVHIMRYLSLIGVHSNKDNVIEKIAFELHSAECCSKHERLEFVERINVRDIIAGCRVWFQRVIALTDICTALCA